MSTAEPTEKERQERWAFIRTDFDRWSRWAEEWDIPLEICLSLALLSTLLGTNNVLYAHYDWHRDATKANQDLVDKQSKLLDQALDETDEEWKGE